MNINQPRLDVLASVNSAKNLMDKELSGSSELYKEVAKMACDMVMQEFIKIDANRK